MSDVRISDILPSDIFYNGYYSAMANAIADSRRDNPNRDPTIGELEADKRALKKLLKQRKVNPEQYQRDIQMLDRQIEGIRQSRADTRKKIDKREQEKERNEDF